MPLRLYNTLKYSKSDDIRDAERSRVPPYVTPLFEAAKTGTKSDANA